MIAPPCRSPLRPVHHRSDGQRCLRTGILKQVAIAVLREGRRGMAQADGQSEAAAPPLR